MTEPCTVGGLAVNYILVSQGGEGRMTEHCRVGGLASYELYFMSIKLICNWD